MSDVALQDVTLAATADEATKVGYTFSSNGRIAWSARYTALALRYGSSDPVDVVRSCILQVDFTVNPWAAEDDVLPYRSRLTATESTDVVEVVTLPPTTEDAVTQSFIGFRSDEIAIRVDGTSEVSTLVFSSAGGL